MRLPSRKVASNRIELRGPVLGEAELRVTPAGTPVLWLVVDCGEPDARFGLPVIFTGERAPALRPQLGWGKLIKVAGSLRAARAGARVSAVPSLEVLAESIEPVD